jgi:hypothetical protein
MGAFEDRNGATDFMKTEFMISSITASPTFQKRLRFMELAGQSVGRLVG